jgi:hypothetical protein
MVHPFPFLGFFLALYRQEGCGAMAAKACQLGEIDPTFGAERQFFAKPLMMEPCT